jgi:O-antigen/teichoic acid export membrane protein
MHKQIVSGSIWMFLGNASQQGFQFLVFILLARQLAPETFGYVALASVVVDIACSLGGWGIVDFMTQRRHLSRRMISHVFVFSVALGLVLSLLVAAGVGIYAQFQGFSLVSQLILWMIPIVILQSLGLVPEALVRRNMDFKWLALRNNVAALVGGSTAVVMAYTGFEPTPVLRFMHWSRRN